MTASPAKVAILVRTKNRPITLIRALDSIIRQTMTDWHIHLLNDGGDSAVVRETAQHYSAQLSGKITFYDNEKPLGRGGALAQLLRASTEEYALIHDDDDTLEPEFLAETVSFLDHEKNSDCSAVVTGNIDVYAKIDNNTLQIENIVAESGQKNDSYIDILSFLKAKIGQFPPIACLFRRELSLSFLDLIAEMNYHEDKTLFSYLLLKGEFATIKKQLSHYYHYTSDENNYLQTNNLEELSLIKETNDHFRKSILNKDEMSEFVCLLQNERRENDLLRQLIIASHSDMIENISTLKNDLNQSMKAIADTLHALNNKIETLNK